MAKSSNDTVRYLSMSTRSRPREFHTTGQTDDGSFYLRCPIPVINLDKMDFRSNHRGELLRTGVQDACEPGMQCYKSAHGDTISGGTYVQETPTQLHLSEGHAAVASCLLDHGAEPMTRNSKESCSTSKNRSNVAGRPDRVFLRLTHPQKDVLF